MVIPKIREYLSVGLAVLACMALAFGVITHLRNVKLSHNLENAVANNAQLVQVNTDNSRTIDQLVQQRIEDDKLISALYAQYEIINNRGSKMADRLDQIRSDNEEFKDILDTKYPIVINSLLNPTAVSHGDADRED